MPMGRAHPRRRGVVASSRAPTAMDALERLVGGVRLGLVTVVVQRGHEVTVALQRLGILVWRHST